MISLLLFILGLIVGSFLNVLIIRYNPEKGLFHNTAVGGRSRCVQCLRKLEWYELIPLASFLMLRGKCRTCKLGISIQYPIVELLTGAIWLLPIFWYNSYHLNTLAAAGENLAWFYLWSGTLVLACTILLLIAIIDFRTGFIPDETSIGIGLVGMLHTFVLAWYNKFDLVYGSWLGNFGMLFGLRGGAITNHIIAGLIGLLLFWIIFTATKGKGMGLGDVKFAGGLGLFLGWPDVLLAFMLAFFIGALAGLLLIGFKKATLHGAIPFGPFMVVGTFMVILFGHELVQWYLKIFGL